MRRTAWTSRPARRGRRGEVPEDIPAAAFTLARARALLDEVRNTSSD